MTQLSDRADRVIAALRWEWPDRGDFPAYVASWWIFPLRARRWLLERRGHRLEQLARIRSGTIVRGRRLRLGRDAIVNHGVVLEAVDDITIGDSAGIAFGVHVLTVSHELGPSRKRHADLTTAPVHIGRGAWIGVGAIIQPGVTVGDGALVMAGAVVTKDVPPDTVVGGVPAKVLDRPLP